MNQDDTALVKRVLAGDGSLIDRHRLANDSGASGEPQAFNDGRRTSQRQLATSETQAGGIILITKGLKAQPQLLRVTERLTHFL
jgi:hypothetical protein